MLMRVLFTILLTTVLVACGGSSSSDDTSNTVQATGTVVDDQGIPLAGARVTVVSASTVTGSSQTVNTDSSGQFALTLDAATALVLKVQKTGYASSLRAAAAAVDNASAASRVVLLPVASTQTFDPAQAAVLRVPGSTARVELAASSLVREDGQAISGTPTVTLTPIDPSADIARMPGLLVDGASGEPIESLGALTVNFTDTTGAPLNLASGQTATIRIPATPAVGATLPAAFPLYHLNETTGRWTQEGTATLQTDPATGAKYYEGTVSHFSTWNADQVMTRTSLDFGTTTAGSICTLPAGLRVVAQGVDYNGLSVAIGNTVIVRQNSQVQLRLLDLNGSVVDALALDSGGANATVRVPRCLTAPPLVTLSGRVAVSSGVLSNYRVQIFGQKMQTSVLPIQADGSYATQVYADRGEVSARLVGTDRGTPDTRVTTTVAAVNASFPDLTVQDTRFELQGCVQGWEDYRQNSVQVGLFKGDTPIGSPQTLRRNTAGGNTAFAFLNAPFNSSLTLRLTAPDATLAEKTTTIAVGNTPAVLGACLSLPVPPRALGTVSGSGFERSFNASASVSGDAPISGYAWTFGDGSTATGVTTNHTYAATGSYTATLTVTDERGQKSSPITMPVVVANGGSVVRSGQQIASGLLGGCVINASGGVECWSDVPDNKALVPGLTSGITAIAAGAQHTCAITSVGALKCWGANHSGQLGDGSTTDSSTPVNVTGLGSGVQAVSAGAGHTCAVTSSGGVKCWGSGFALGHGSAVNSSVPVDVTGLASGVVAIAAGAGHTCAATSGAGVLCWGNGGSGQLGNGDTASSSVPVVVSGLTESGTALSAGSAHSCALTAAGGVRCWGSNTSGQLGNNAFANSATPVVVGAASSVTALNSGTLAISGQYLHTCAISADGTVWCWGSSVYGQINKSRSDSFSPSYAQPSSNDVQSGAAIGISTGRYATCMLRKDRSVQCWGWGESSEPGG
jgi:alpha-tubulin suppressor-like RCC1 family protein